MKTPHLALCITLLSILISSNAVLAAQKEASMGLPNGALKGQVRWQAVESKSDDFNQKELDSKKWDNAPKTLIVGAWTFDKKNTYIADGKLTIEATQESHTRPFPDVCQGGAVVQRQLYYKSGAVRTHTDGVYGFYEAKIKGVKIFPGLSPAFWLYSDGHPFPDRKVVGSVDYSEIDIVELQQADWRSPDDEDGVNVMDHNLHARIVGKNGKTFWRRPKPYPDAQLLHYKAPFDPSQDFHTYAVENRKDKISWYVDGELIGSKPNLFWHRPMHVILSMGLRRMFIKYNAKCQRADPNPNYVVQEGYPEDARMLVDYVKTWEALPSIWLDSPDKYKKVMLDTSATLDVSVGYHGGSNDYVEAKKHNGITLSLVEIDKKGKKKTLQSASDESVASDTKKYGGETTLSLSLKDVKPSSDLARGHYYALSLVFRSSNGEDIYLEGEHQRIDVLK